MEDLNGQTIDHYQIKEIIGEGGMAVVYKAFNIRLERFVALKLIKVQSKDNETFIKRFDREAKALAKLSHPNIVNIHDYGNFEGTPYLVMEYIPGGSLKEKMGKQIPYEEAANILLPIVEALEYAHTQGVIHRDIKPSNILQSTSGTSMLSDFGIAKVLQTGVEGSDLTAAGSGIGTPYYMSPEQGQGLQIDQRSDIYSLGVVFYEMVTGKKPYTADTPLSVIVQHATAPLPRPREIVPDLPDIVEKFIFKALAKNPEYRFRDMSDAKEELHRIVSLAQRRQTAKETPQTLIQPLQGFASPAQDDLQTRIDADIRLGQDPLPQPIFQYQAPPQVSSSSKVPPSASQIPEIPVGKKKNLWIYLAGGVLLIGICGVIIVVGSFLIFGEGISKSLSKGNLPSATQIILPASTNTSVPDIPTSTIPTPTATQAQEQPETEPTFYNPVALWPLFGNSEEMQAETEKSDEERAPSIYSLMEKDSENDLETYYSGTLQVTDDVIISRGWCTTTQEILDQNLEHISFELEINGRVVYESFSYGYFANNTDGNPCYFVNWLTLEWPPGTYLIHNKMIVHETINDGWEEYPPSVHQYIIDVNVNP